jgi:hypothetical protein
MPPATLEDGFPEVDGSTRRGRWPTSSYCSPRAGVAGSPRGLSSAKLVASRPSVAPALDAEGRQRAGSPTQGELRTGIRSSAPGARR